MAQRLIAVLCILLAAQVTGRSPRSDKPVLNCCREESTCNFSFRVYHLFAVTDDASGKILCGCKFITVGLRFWPCSDHTSGLGCAMLRSVLLWSFCLPSIQVLNVFPLSFSYTDYMFLTLAYRTISAVPCPATVFSIFPLFCFDSSISPFLILLVLLLELLFHIFSHSFLSFSSPCTTWETASWLYCVHVAFCLNICLGSSLQIFPFPDTFPWYFNALSS